MKNIFIHHRINKCISILNEAVSHGDISESTIKLLYSPKYIDAMRILEDKGCIDVNRAWGGLIISINLTNKAFAVYSLERHDIWVNRIVGFIFGVLTSVAAAFIIRMLPL